MNRANFGNVVTNGMQILSVAGTTAAGAIRASRQQHLADASSALNNLSEDELQQVGEMRANKLRDEMARYNAGGESPYQHLSNEEAGLYQEKRAEQMRKFINEDSESVDDLMEGTAFSRLQSPQSSDLRTFIENNFKYNPFYVKGEKGRFKKGTIEDLGLERKEGDEDNDADV